MIERVRELAARESGLAVVTVMRDDGSMTGSVVNAGVLDHPVTGETIVGFVAVYAKKLEHLRVCPTITIVFRSGWDWATVEGEAQLAGPDDPCEGLDADAILRTIRAIYAAAVGGDPDDWAHLDDEIETERHTAVLIRPTRTYANPTEPEDQA